MKPLLILLVGLACATRLAAADVDFNRDIRPLLSDRCFACHGPDEAHRKGDLRLDDAKNLTEDRGGYRIVTPGKPDESELIYRLTAEDDSERMPPKKFGKPLKPAEIELLRRWVKEGGAVQEGRARRG